MRIVNLASGSKANSTFLGYDNTKILIDVGLTETKLENELNQIGENLKNINAVLITHEHIDHIRSLSMIAKKHNIQIYVHKRLAESAAFAKYAVPNEKLHTFDENSFCIGSLEIMPFEISHDAIAPVGFVVHVCESSAKVGFATDLGIVTEKVKEALFGTKMVFLEANHDENMLAGGRYPKIVKERIAGPYGHLSNKQSLALADFLFDGGTKCFVLSHLSENNNTIEKAYSYFADHFEARGLKLDNDVFLRVSFQDKHGNNFILKEEFDGK